MTERAQKIYDAWNDVYNLQRECYTHHIPSALAAAIREIVNEFQYYQCCEEEGVEDMVVDARVLYELANELEELK
jgi:hypothetical protein